MGKKGEEWASESGEMEVLGILTRAVKWTPGSPGKNER